MRGVAVKALRRAVQGMKLRNAEWRRVKRAYEAQPRDQKDVAAAAREARR